MRWKSFERIEEKDDKDYEGETKENLDTREGEQRSLFAQSLVFKTFTLCEEK